MDCHLYFSMRMLVFSLVWLVNSSLSTPIAFSNQVTAAATHNKSLNLSDTTATIHRQPHSKRGPSVAVDICLQTYPLLRAIIGSTALLGSNAIYSPWEQNEMTLHLSLMAGGSGNSILTVESFRQSVEEAVKNHPKWYGIHLGEIYESAQAQFLKLLQGFLEPMNNHCGGSKGTLKALEKLDAELETEGMEVMMRINKDRKDFTKVAEGLLDYNNGNGNAEVMTAEEFKVQLKVLVRQVQDTTEWLEDLGEVDQPRDRTSLFSEYSFAWRLFLSIQDPISPG